MTPQEFVKQIKLETEQGYDPEGSHSTLDQMMEEILIQFGYEEGVKLIRKSTRWYA